MSAERSQRQYIAILAAISGGILVVGALLKPVKAPDAPIPQSEMVRLQALTQRKSLEDLTSYFARIADDVKPGLVWVEGLGSGGVVWDERGVIVAGAPGELADEKLTAVTSGGEMPLETGVLSVDFPVAALKAPAGSQLRPVFRASAESLKQGTWILQVAGQRDGGRLFTPGIYAGVVTVSCGEFDLQAVKTSLPLTEAMLGGGLFDMDGNLLGVVLRCGDEYNVVTPEGVDTVLATANSLAGQLLRRYGLRIQELDNSTRAYFKTKDGVLVTEVWEHSPSDAVGLIPGDVIQALDEAPVNVSDDLARLVLPVAFPSFDLRVLRGGRPVRVNLPARGSESPYTGRAAGSRGISLASLPEGYLIDAVAPGSRADRAMIRAGDRLLLVGHRRFTTLAAIRRVLSDQDDAPVFVVVQRGPRKLGVLLR